MIAIESEPAPDRATGTFVPPTDICWGGETTLIIRTSAPIEAKTPLAPVGPPTPPSDRTASLRNGYSSGTCRHSKRLLFKRGACAAIHHDGGDGVCHRTVIPATLGKTKRSGGEIPGRAQTVPKRAKQKGAEIRVQAPL